MPPGVRRRMLPTGAYAVHAMEWGPPDGAPVVMLHGNPAWGFLYRHVVRELLQGGLRLITLDLVGLGLSDHPRRADEHTLANHAGWIGQALDAMDLPPAVFVVADWGGPIGLRALAERPQLARGLVLLNTVIGPPRPAARASWFHRFARLPLLSDAVFRLGQFPQATMWGAQGRWTSIPPRALLAYLWPLRGLSRNAAPLALARMVPLPGEDHPSIPELQRAHDFAVAFPGPVRLVWGMRDPVLGRVINRLEKLLPGAESTRTAGGHFLQEEVPREIAAAVRSAD
jgi:pimeloyl-ACP methyl ester carboxylesterase